jgi:hypothetical protein
MKSVLPSTRILLLAPSPDGHWDFIFSNLRVAPFFLERLGPAEWDLVAIDVLFFAACTRVLAPIL